MARALHAPAPGPAPARTGSRSLLLPCPGECSEQEELEVLSPTSSVGSPQQREQHEARRLTCRVAAGLALGLAVTCGACGAAALGLRRGMRSSSSLLSAVEEVLEGTCAKTFTDNCMEKPCCGEYTTCFEKEEGFALCRPTCAVGKPDEAPPWDPEADGKAWSCKIVGEKAEAPSWKPSYDAPSVYCFVVTLVRGNEPELLRRQLATGTGVFGCNAYSVFSEREMVLGPGPTGLVSTTAIGGPMSTVAQNTADFLRTYQKILEANIYRQHLWTLKVDPDTLLLAPRLRTKLQEHSEILPVSQKLYFRNCEKYKSVQGPLELFTQAAAVAFFSSLETCKQNDWINQKGEDWFFGHCMESLGIHGVEDYGLLDDAYCMHHKPEVQCRRDMAAFHPFKTTEGYMECLKDTE